MAVVAGVTVAAAAVLIQVAVVVVVVVRVDQVAQVVRWVRVPANSPPGLRRAKAPRMDVAAVGTAEPVAAALAVPM